MQNNVRVYPDTWEAQRMGRFTASEIYKLMTEPRTKAAKESGELSEGAKTYVEQKVAEMLTGHKNEFMSMATEHGKELEPEAAIKFAEYLNQDVTSMDWIYCGGDQPVFQPYGNNCGGSPDIIISNLDAIAEIKCPFESKNHIYHLLTTSETIAERLPEYYCQMQCNMLFCEKSKAYFVSYDPRFHDDKLQLKVIEVERNDDFLERVTFKIASALDYRDKLLKVLQL